MPDKMTDAERELVDQMMKEDSAPGEVFMPVPDNRAMNLFVIHALRDSASQQRESNKLMTAVKDDLASVREQMIRWEAHVAKVATLEATVLTLATEITQLKSERDRRAGMQWLVEWIGKYVPWLAAAAAAVWALKVNPK